MPPPSRDCSVTGNCSGNEDYKDERSLSFRSLRGSWYLLRLVRRGVLFHSRHDDNSRGAGCADGGGGAVRSDSNNALPGDGSDVDASSCDSRGSVRKGGGLPPCRQEVGEGCQ